MYKYELHSHTSECDLVAELSGADYARLYKEAGYDGIVITDHYFNTFFDWYGGELEGKPHEAVIDRWLRGYRSAKAVGDEIGITVLLGAEVRVSDTINDYLVYGLTEEFLYNAPRLNEMKNLDELLRHLPKEEAYNAGTDKFRNSLAHQFAEHYGLAKTSGSDVHRMNRFAKGGIETDRRILTIKDLTDVLRSGEYRLIESY